MKLPAIGPTNRRVPKWQGRRTDFDTAAGAYTSRGEPSCPEQRVSMALYTSWGRRPQTAHQYTDLGPRGAIGLPRRRYAIIGRRAGDHFAWPRLEGSAVNTVLMPNRRDGGGPGSEFFIRLATSPCPRRRSLNVRGRNPRTKSFAPCEGTGEGMRQNA